MQRWASGRTRCCDVVDDRLDGALPAHASVATATVRCIRPAPTRPPSSPDEIVDALAVPATATSARTGTTRSRGTIPAHDPDGVTRR